MKSSLFKYLAMFMAVPIALEVGVRCSGLADFPLYDADNIVGYIPKPSQAGSFLHVNDWQFNSKSMGAVEFAPTVAIDNLLVGDSVVAGGNPFRQQDRLGPQLSRALAQPVWPIAAGSWSLRNELSYLRIHPDVVRESDRIIFILNSGDFDRASSWSCELTHPRHYPLLRSIYVFRKYVYDWQHCGATPQELQVPEGDWRPEFSQFLHSAPADGKEILIFLYPNRNEVDGKGRGEFGLEVRGLEILKLSETKVLVFNIARDLRWKQDLYRDDIHPSVKGINILANIIASPSKGSKVSL